jgi:ABC-2 type transport system permease protein
MVHRSIVTRLLAPIRANANVTRELAITQFKLKYTGSLLGYVWSLVKPLLIFGIMYVVFAVLLNAGKGTVNFPLQLLVGVVLWSFFAETTGTAINAIVSQSSLVQRAYFPRSILVVATTSTALMTFVINMTLIVAVATPIHRLDLGLRSLVALPLFIELYLLILGVSLLLSALFVFFRDLGHIWEILLQVLFYASGVVFPIAAIHSGLKYLLLANPVAQIIEDTRHVLVTPRAPWTVEILGLERYLVPFAIVGALFTLGVYVFSRASPSFAEHL